MAKSSDELSRDIHALGQRLEKAEDKREKLAGEIHKLISDRVVPTEAKVNQIQGIGKWVAPTVILLLLSIAGTGAAIFYRLGRIEGKIGQHDTALASIRNDATQLAAKVIVSGPNPKQAVQEVLASKPTPTSIPKIRAVIEEATSKKIEIPQQTFLEIAKNLMSIPESSPAGDAAWQAMVSLAKYRCSFNEPAAPSRHFTVPITSSEFPNWVPQNVHEQKFLRILGKVPVESAARFELIERPLKHELLFGPEWIFVIPHEHRLRLDGMRLRNVVFTGVEIDYSGSPLIMDNVYFVNCRFRAPRSNSTERFMLAIVDSASVTFKST